MTPPIAVPAPPVDPPPPPEPDVYTYPPAGWQWCAPYLRKLYLAALARHGVTPTWPAA